MLPRMAIATLSPTPTEFGATLEERLAISMWRAKLTPPKIGRKIGVTAQTVRTWLDPEQPSRPRHSDVLAWAIVTNTPVGVLDPEHPLAGVVVADDAPDPDDDGDGRTPPGTRTLNLVIQGREAA